MTNKEYTKWNIDQVSDCITAIHYTDFSVTYLKIFINFYSSVVRKLYFGAEVAGFDFRPKKSSTKFIIKQLLFPLLIRVSVAQINYREALTLWIKMCLCAIYLRILKTEYGIYTYIECQQIVQVLYWLFRIMQPLLKVKCDTNI